MTYISAILSFCLFFIQPAFVLAQEEGETLISSGVPAAIEAAEDIAEVSANSNQVVPVDTSEDEIVYSNDDTPADVPVASMESLDEDVVTSEDVTTVSQSATASELLQQTFNTQDVLDPTGVETESVIEIATPPEETILPDAINQPIDAVGEEEVSDMAPEEETQVVDQQPEPLQETNPEPLMDMRLSEEPILISLEEMEPTPDYVFSVNTGKQIPTKKRIRHETRDRSNNLVITETEQTVSAVPTITADNTEGVMDISGACASTYYVVLIYKQESDYDRDRSSYVINKAYPCEGGAFSYKVQDLPLTLKNGTYYVLIGEQGDSGPWSPVTALTQVEIQRN